MSQTQHHLRKVAHGSLSRVLRELTTTVTDNETDTADSSPLHDDYLPISYAGGFAVFLALSIAVVVMSAIIVCVLLDNKINATAVIWPVKHAGVLVVLMGASTVLLVWGGTARQDEDIHTDGLAPIIIGAICLLAFSTCFLCPLRSYYIDEFARGQSVHPMTNCEHSRTMTKSVLLLFLLTFAVATIIVVLPGLTLLTIYCRKMKLVDEYEYAGPMRLTGSRLYFETGYRCGKVDPCAGYKGQIQVSWGREWGCPSDDASGDNAQWCQFWLTDSKCTQKVCEHTDGFCDSSSDKLEEAMTAAETCIKERYDLYEWFEKIDFLRPEYDLALPPDQDETWPSVFAYGDCSSCKAMLSTPVDLALNIKRAGTGFCIAGTVLFGILLLVGIMWWSQSKKRNGDGD